MQKDCDILIVTGMDAGGKGAEFDAAWGLAEGLQAYLSGAVRVLLLGDQVEDAAEAIARRSGCDVTAVSDPLLATYTHEAYRRIIASEIRTAAPLYVCMAHTLSAAEWAPSVAVDLGAACITGVDRIDCIDGRMVFQKDLYGGKVKGRYAAPAETTLLTVQPGSFKPDGTGAVRSGTVTVKEQNGRLSATRHLGTIESPSNTANFDDAHVIVAAGMGLGDRENLVWIDRLASLFPKAAVGGSRLVCDRQWLGYDRQIGVTGATVAPALYIACGISGAAQHCVGMRGAGFVVAINTDPHAPIFNQADVCIVEDLTAFIPLLMDACRPHQDP